MILILSLFTTYLFKSLQYKKGLHGKAVFVISGKFNVV